MISFFNDADLRAIAQRKFRRHPDLLSATSILAAENLEILTKQKSIDVFLSHNVGDADVVLGVKARLELEGLSVYAKWVEQANAEKLRITPDSAEHLRSKLTRCKSLIYAFMVGTTDSDWMPWELGFFDGLLGAVCMFPILSRGRPNFVQERFASLYPYVSSEIGSIFVNRGTAPVESLGNANEITDFRTLKSWMARKAKVNIRS